MKRRQVLGYQRAQQSRSLAREPEPFPTKEARCWGGGPAGALPAELLGSAATWWEGRAAALPHRVRPPGRRGKATGAAGGDRHGGCSLQPPPRSQGSRGRRARELRGEHGAAPRPERSRGLGLGPGPFPWKR